MKPSTWVKCTTFEGRSVRVERAAELSAMCPVAQRSGDLACPCHCVEEDVEMTDREPGVLYVVSTEFLHPFDAQGTPRDVTRLAVRFATGWS